MKFRYLLISLLCIYCLFTLPIASLASNNNQLRLANLNNYNLLPNANTFEDSSISLKDLLANAPKKMQFTAGDCNKEIDFSSDSNNLSFQIKGKAETKREISQADLDKVKVEETKTENLADNKGVRISSKFNFKELKNAKYEEVFAETIYQQNDLGEYLNKSKLSLPDGKIVEEATIKISKKDYEEAVKGATSTSEDKVKIGDNGKVGPIRNAIAIELLIVIVLLTVLIGVMMWGWSAYCQDACWNPCAGACATAGRSFAGAVGTPSGFFNCTCTCKCGALFAPPPPPPPPPVVVVDNP
jgi:hypothetical protein